jgi:ADP-ribosylglycohydrolase
MLCTAEINAATNLLSRSACATEGDAAPEWCRRHRNPYREWIGAQIRADAWAYAAAGDPALAASLAWRDASWTHERNGIYGEMFFAALIAAAFREQNFHRLVEAGLAQIPAECRLAQWVRRCLGWLEEYSCWEGAVERLESELGTMHVVHTINNALLTLIALYYGKGCLDETICIAVMCGLDTDCNAATAGSVVGAMRGHARLESRLAPRLNDTARLKMIGFHEVRFRQLAERHAAVWKRIRHG